MLGRATGHLDTFCRDNLPPAHAWPVLDGYGTRFSFSAELNIAEVLLEGTIIDHGGDRPCLIGADFTWTYLEVRTVADQIAFELSVRRGMVPGNRVMIWGENSPWLAAIWLGVLRAGGVAVPISPLLTTYEAASQRNATRSQYLIVSTSLAHRAPESDELEVVVYGSESDEDLTRCTALDTTGFKPARTCQDDVAFLVSTSGTTGSPKVTSHFHRDFLAIADAYAKHGLAPRPDDVFVGTPHLSFTYGLGGRLVFAMRAGASTVLTGDDSALDLPRLIERHNATICVSGPTAYRALTAMAVRKELRSLRLAISSGESLPADVYTEFLAMTDTEILDVIGTTECTSNFAGSRPGLVRPGSVGTPLPGYRVRILDSAGLPVPAGTDGLLVVQGPTGCRYLNDERQRAYVQNGWNVTGDVFAQDEDGYLWYRGRADDLINSSGYKIYPAEIEAILSQHEEVSECMVRGDLVDGAGEVLTAYVVVGEDATPDQQLLFRLRTFLRRYLAPYKVPRVINFVESLPRTVTGKIRRSETPSLRS